MKRKKKNIINKEVNLFLKEFLSDQIQFCKPHQIANSVFFLTYCSGWRAKNWFP